MSELNVLQRIFSSLDKVVEVGLTKLLPRVMKPSVTLAKRYAPVDTGKLRGTVKYTQTGLKGAIETDTSYAKYVQQADPFVIRAINDKADSVDSKLTDIAYDLVKKTVEK